jgi:predicted NBD/HSP70 family sugar kinase
MIIQEEGRPFQLCGQRGCLSSYVSGAAFREIYGIGPSKCEDREVWADYAKKLTLGIINILAMWAPNVIILGGSITNKFEDYFKEPLLDELSKQELFVIPPIFKSELGDNSGLYGGLILLKQVFNDNI